MSITDLASVSLERKVHVLLAVANRLAAVHNSNDVHGALGTASVVVDSDGDVALINAHATPFIWFSPPETYLGTGGPSVPTQPGDMWALGCIAYMLFTGHHPFLMSFGSDREPVAEPDDGPTDWQALADDLLSDTPDDEVVVNDSPLGAMRRAAAGTFVPLSDMCPDIPPSLDALIAALLSVTPGHRPDANDAVLAIANAGGWLQSHPTPGTQ